MTQKKQQKNKTYQVRLNCQRCNKFIDIDFSMVITERNQYGKPERYIPAKLPEYINHMLDNGVNRLYEENHWNQPTRLGQSPASNSLNSHSQQRELLIVCKECKQIAKLRE